jgi:membrane protein YqaA with SNARE-associated domain
MEDNSEQRLILDSTPVSLDDGVVVERNSFIKTLRNFSRGFAKSIKDLDARQWQKIAFTLAGLAAITIGFTHLSQLILARINLPLDKYASICYLTVFVTFLIANLMLFTPLPIAMTVLLTASLMWNPFLVGMAAALGASLGELSGYFAGRLGRNIFIKENFMCSLNVRLCNSRLTQDVQRYGPLTIGILAAQPILPFDIGGMIAGSIKMNLPKFFGSMLAGKSVKYVMIAYFAGMLSYIPFLKLG